jgi:aryl-alcohol dehydrogenase-like predicted oxidoreductase
MQKRRLGKDGPLVTALGLGCMGMSFGYGPADETESAATLRRAVELGCTFFDTAEIYGPFKNEELLGRVLKDVRKDLFIATKFGSDLRPGAAPGALNSRPEHVKEVADASLKRLQTDVIDLYYQHRVDPAVPIEDTVGAMADLVKAGKVRYLGLSEASPATIRRAYKVHPIAALQSEYSLWERNVEKQVLPTCRELGVAFVPFSPLGRGQLTGAIKAAELPEGDFRRNMPRFSGENAAANQNLIDALTALAKQRGVTAAQLALAWLLHRGEDIIPIPGARRIKHLEENLAAAEVGLSAAELAAIEAAIPEGAVHGERVTPAQAKTLDRTV